MKFDLVFEGGGAKGMAFVGAMQEFVNQKHTYGRLLGTSAGAITATLLAVEYSVSELMATLNETQDDDDKSVFTGFMSTPPGFSEQDIQESATLALFQNIDVPGLPNWIEDKLDRALARALLSNLKFANLFSFIERGGWYSAEKFVQWMKRKLDEGEFRGRPRRFGGMTFGEFHAATGRDLSLVAADTSSGHMLVLNHATAPNLPLVWAVRMSMSIPMVWPEVRWQDEWGAYRGRTMTGHLIVDGGLLSNFPIELFISRAAHVTAVMGDTVSENVLGLLIDETTPVPDAPPPPPPPIKVDLQGLQLVQRIQRLMDTVLGAHDKMVTESLSSCVVRLPAGGYGTTEFDMSDARRKALVKAGRQATSDHFDTFEPQAHGALGMVLSAPMGAPTHADKIATKMLAY